MQRSLKAHQIIIMLGGGTLFTAIGLFAASVLNLGVQIYSFRGLFQTASILGTMDTLLLLMSGAKLNLFSGIPLTCLALGLIPIREIWATDTLRRSPSVPLNKGEAAGRGILICSV